MSNIFIAFGFISFVMFLYTVYAQGQQIKELKKTVRHQRHLLKATSTPLPQDPDSVKQRFDESWAEIEKIFDRDITKN